MAKLLINADITKGQISKNIYGHFSEHLGRCIYEGIWVGKDSKIPNTDGIRNDVLDALRTMKVPVLRWPGGCFADEYHWKDGIGPKENRKRMVNTNWGGVVEDNSFGTHEFMRLCELIGAEPYINGNVGSGTVQEMSEWVEYMTFDGESPMSKLREQNGHKEAWKVKYFGVGNESWGCGGNMRPEYYADEFRRYAVFCRNYGDNKLYKIACGPNAQDYNWMETVLKIAGHAMDGISLHYYSLPTGSWTGSKGVSTGFTDKEWFELLHRALFMEELVTKHSTIMDKYDPEKRIGLLFDEWGTWYDVEPGTNPGFLYQQNTLRDAIVAAIGLNIFNQHCDRVKMANIAQLVNVLQAPILTEGEKMILTPTYHVFEMFKVHQDATLVDFKLENEDYTMDGVTIPKLSASASVNDKGELNITIANLSHRASSKLSTELRGNKYNQVSARILTADALDTHNTFENPEAIKPEAFNGLSLRGSKLTGTIPAKSVMVITLK